MEPRQEVEIKKYVDEYEVSVAIFLEWIHVYDYFKATAVNIEMCINYLQSH